MVGEWLQGSIGLASDQSLFPSAFTNWKTSVWNPAANNLTPQEQQKTQLSNWAGDFMDEYVPYAYDATMLAAKALHRSCFSQEARRLAPDTAEVNVWQATATAAAAATTTRNASAPRSLASSCDGYWNNGRQVRDNLYAVNFEGLTGNAARHTASYSLAKLPPLQAPFTWNRGTAVAGFPTPFATCRVGSGM